MISPGLSIVEFFFLLMIKNITEPDLDVDDYDYDYDYDNAVSP